MVDRHMQLACCRRSSSLMTCYFLRIPYESSAMTCELFARPAQCQLQVCQAFVAIAMLSANFVSRVPLHDVAFFLQHRGPLQPTG
jgi:hypothetical protein